MCPTLIVAMCLFEWVEERTGIDRFLLSTFLSVVREWRMLGSILAVLKSSSPSPTRMEIKYSTSFWNLLVVVFKLGGAAFGVSFIKWIACSAAMKVVNTKIFIVGLC
ncbi:unnamed protein product [Eruca vesicaria subsp. sativa]|uniref:Uncharacterized protein n=1 Tax=Eruca vesicaria subsp. sativa TaxID=29727 RepID=A0ABC8L7F4_ERUVS|nr:unnamed protein product [Eruca vesicaria subsp. sativa]